MRHLKQAEAEWLRRFGHAPPTQPREEPEPLRVRLAPGAVRRTVLRPEDQRTILPIELRTAVEVVRERLGENAHPYPAEVKLLAYATVVLVASWGGRLEHVICVAEDQILASIEGEDALPTFRRMPGMQIPIPRSLREEVAQ